VKKKRGAGAASTKVLIAGRRSMARDALRALLESRDDVRVVGAVSGGREALAAIEQLMPHVLLFDLAAAFGDGLDTARTLTLEKPDVSLIVLSTHDSGAPIQGVLRAGARGLVTWHSEGEELLKAVREVTSGRHYIAANLAGKVIDSLRRRPGSAGDDLTATEREILALVADGQSNAEVATRLRLATRTVETYRIRLMHKLGLDDLASLVKFAIRHGITSVD